MSVTCVPFGHNLSTRAEFELSTKFISFHFFFKLNLTVFFHSFWLSLGDGACCWDGGSFFACDKFIDPLKDSKNCHKRQYNARHSENHLINNKWSLFAFKTQFQIWSQLSSCSASSCFAWSRTKRNLSKPKKTLSKTTKTAVPLCTFRGSIARAKGI